MRDPVHGFIRLDEFDFVLPAISTSSFQRLRRLSQLGLSSTTYPSATHTRFAHCIGVMYVFETVCRHLLAQTDLKSDEQNHLLRVGCASALLHDLGHGPLSHVSEHVLGFSHEEITKQLIDSREIAEVLDKFAIPRGDIKSILNGTAAGPKALLSQLISSQLDADRLDYLVRDAYFTGVGFGNIDLIRILNMLRVHQGSGVLKGYAIALNKGKYSLESYILTRYIMYKDVYFHKATRGAEMLVKAAFTRAKELQSSLPLPAELGFWASGTPPTSDDILGLDDHITYAIISRWAKADDPILSELCNRFLQRKLFKAIDFPKGGIDIYAQGKILEKLAEKHKLNPTYHFLSDTAVGSTYRPYEPAARDNEQSTITNIFVYDEEGVPKEISHLSKVVEALGEKEYINRIYVPEEVVDETKSIFKKL